MTKLKFSYTPDYFFSIPTWQWGFLRSHLLGRFWRSATRITRYWSSSGLSGFPVIQDIIARSQLDYCDIFTKSQLWHIISSPITAHFSQSQQIYIYMKNTATHSEPDEPKSMPNDRTFDTSCFSNLSQRPI